MIHCKTCGANIPDNGVCPSCTLVLSDDEIIEHLVLQGCDRDLLQYAEYLDEIKKPWALMTQTSNDSYFNGFDSREDLLSWIKDYYRYPWDSNYEESIEYIFHNCNLIAHGVTIHVDVTLTIDGVTNIGT